MCTIWWVWTYANTQEIIITITLTDTPNTSQSFLYTIIIKGHIVQFYGCDCDVFSQLLSVGNLDDQHFLLI